MVGEQGREPTLLLPVLLERGFTLEYLHSVHRTPVREHFTLAPGNELILDYTVYRSLGVGTPFLPEEGHLERRDGEFVLSGLDRRFKVVNLAFTPLTSQALLIGGRRYDLADYFPAGSLLAIQARPCTPAELLWQTLNPGRRKT